MQISSKTSILEGPGGNAPAAAQGIALLVLLLVVILVAAAISSIWSGLQIDSNSEGQGRKSQEQSLKDGLRQGQEAAGGQPRPELKPATGREIDTQFGALLKQLPNKAQMDALLVDINQAGLGRGPRSLTCSGRRAPSETACRDFYAELPIQIRVKLIGGYHHDMGQFASDIGQPVAHAS